MGAHGNGSERIPNDEVGPANNGDGSQPSNNYCSDNGEGDLI
eukprot:CAMPEP_0201900554 /NCGR_PEP_ID=MMETSP0902-20130614/52579_1 /ASSEMBLY_ACC=CAM_ASM_000551 /TAXON_ID=420261 /ORGANISM="Thalassiosira antarctica, Strain CCMP982" /LENGTH=41 /DNA_ID= /DNA_START= /DNA_END= /DNA_ORIENTATION=